MKSLAALQSPQPGLRAAVAVAMLIGIWSDSDAAGRGTAVAQPVDAVCAPAGGALAIHVCGNRLVDGRGASVQLRGVNVSGLEAVAIFGWSPGDPWGGQPPDFHAIKSWGANSVRLPLNQASWLGGSCIDAGGFGSTVIGSNSKIGNKPGQSIKADPGGNYQATVVKTVAEAAKAGFYVILDLHLSAPGNACPMVQNAMADADHSVAFWSSVAKKFKDSPHVIFELFNEPFLDQAPLAGNAWTALISGNGVLSAYLTQGNPNTIHASWTNAGMQQLLDAIRSSGATNVILSGTLAYDTHTEGWLQHHPTDTLTPSQLGAVWHVYPNSTGSSLVNCIGTPSVCSAATIAAAQDIITQGYPVVITEFGDAVESKATPISSMLLPMADTHGMSYLAWTWNAWPGTSHYLITDSAGSPVPGFGDYVKAHYLCRAAGNANCK